MDSDFKTSCIRIVSGLSFIPNYWCTRNTLQVAGETISNIHTVVSLGREEVFYERFRDSQYEPLR